jgi:dihydrofolate synthase/folylpolyglutamate synthase
MLGPMPPPIRVAPIQTAAEAAAWLEGLIDLEKTPGFAYERLQLAPIRELLRRLDHPERGLPAIHIAGSKGKGSTALLVEAVLLAAGRRVGTFTSPHLEQWSERFRIDGRDVEGPALARAVERLRGHVEALRGGSAALVPSFFDATTAAALLLFREAEVDFAVLEVGLGGRLDSTNVCAPVISCVTSIELEHTDKLGTRLSEIAAEKAGILKAGVPAVLGTLPSEARVTVLARAEEVGAPVVELGRDFRVEARAEGLEGLRLHLVDGPVDVEAQLPVLGAHQATNAALALASARRALGDSSGELADAVVRGLASAELPGRLEVVGRDPMLLLDSAHTAVSARALARSVARLPRRNTHWVLSVSSGKDVGSILEAVLPLADEVTVTRAEPRRSLSPEAIATAVRSAAPDLPLRVVPNPHLALRAAREGLGPGDLLCATGSVYLAGIARRVLRDRVPPERVGVSRRPPQSSVAEP